MFSSSKMVTAAIIVMAAAILVSAIPQSIADTGDTPFWDIDAHVVNNLTTTKWPLIMNCSSGGKTLDTRYINIGIEYEWKFLLKGSTAQPIWDCSISNKDRHVVFRAYEDGVTPSSFHQVYWAVKEDGVYQRDYARVLPDVFKFKWQAGSV